MPLKSGKSKAVFHENLKKELAAGKPLKQALAISFAQQHKAMGGMIEEDGDLDEEHERNIVELNTESDMQGDIANPQTQKLEAELANKLHEESEEHELMHMSEGGVVEQMPEEHEIIKAMKKYALSKKKMASGGMC